MNPGQVKSGQIKSSRINSTPTRQQIGILNRFLSARVGQLGPGSTNLVCGYSAPGEELPVSRKSSSDSDGPRRDHRPSRGPSGGWRQEAVIEFSLENLDCILHGLTNLSMSGSSTDGPTNNTRRTWTVLKSCAVQSRAEAEGAAEQIAASAVCLGGRSSNRETEGRGPEVIERA